MSITSTIKANYAELKMISYADADGRVDARQAVATHRPGKPTAAMLTDGLVITPAPTEAESLKAEADNIAAAAQAQVDALHKAAAAVSTIPVVGPVIAAILLAIAAVIAMIAQSAKSGLEKQAAAKEQEAAAASIGHNQTRHKITDP